MVCAVCRNRPKVVGLLCEPCRDEVAAPIGLLPQQILATVAKPTGDVLVDQWGRAHPLEARTLIGRSTEGLGLLILDASISRHHAQLTRETNGWQLRDLGSSNGTFVNEVQLEAPQAVNHGDCIAIGAVGFYLVRELGVIPEIEVDESLITTIQSLQRLTLPEPGPLTDGVPTFVEREHTDPGLPLIPLKLSEPTGGGGGVLEIGDVTVQLSANQTELFLLLARRMLDEPHQPSNVRGFVRTSELIGSLSWDTREPDDNHVKQLIRRARRMLMREGLGDLIESRKRFGYRLRMIPEMDSTRSRIADSRSGS